MYKYEIIIYWSNDDQAFLAEVPELPGCMADGKTLEEAIKNVQESIRVWLEIDAEDGNPVPIPKGRLIYA